MRGCTYFEQAYNDEGKPLFTPIPGDKRGALESVGSYCGKPTLVGSYCEGHARKMIEWDRQEVDQILPVASFRPLLRPLKPLIILWAHLRVRWMEWRLEKLGL